MRSTIGFVYETMPKIRVVALSSTEGDQDVADEVVATTLKNAIDEAPGCKPCQHRGLAGGSLCSGPTVRLNAPLPPSTRSGAGAQGKPAVNS